MGVIQYQCPRDAEHIRGRGTATLEVEMHPQSTLRRGSVARICKQCGVEFLTVLSEVARGNGKFCSPECSARSLFVPLWERITRSLYIGPPSAYRPDLGPCWLSTLKPDSNGYVAVRKAPVATRRLHQLMYERLVGSIPEGHELDHLCRVRGCCCPFHLEAVTHRVNGLRGFSPNAINAAKTACLRGHLFDEENTYFRPDNGLRGCKACRKAVHDRQTIARRQAARRKRTG